MRLFNFSSFPVLCCLLCFSKPTSAYAEDKKKDAPIQKTGVKTAINAKTNTRSPRVRKPEIKKKITHVKPIEKKQANAPAKVESPVAKNQAKAPVKKVESPVVKNQAKAPVKKVESPVVKNQAKAPVKKVESPVVKNQEKVLVESTIEKEINIDTTKKVEENKIETPIDSSKEVKTTLTEVENDNVEDKTLEKNDRRERRRNRRANLDKVQVNDEEVIEKKEEILVKKNRRAQKSKEIEKENPLSQGEVTEDTSEENFVGISSSDYLGNIKNLVDSYLGGNSKSSHIDAEKSLSGKDLLVYKREYSSYDNNGNQKLMKHDIQFKNKLTRRIDLKEKVNSPFFRPNKEITKYLIEGVKAGKVVAFSDRFLSQKISQKEFTEQLLMPRDVESIEDDSNILQNLFFDAHDVSVLEIDSNWIFDKNNSDFSEDPYLIKLIIPAEKFSDTTKIQRIICHIKYNDVIEYLKTIPEAVWIDEKNEAVELTLADAFSMRVYDSIITYIGNRDCNNGDVADLFGTKEDDLSYSSRQANNYKYKFEGSLDSI